MEFKEHIKILQKHKYFIIFFTAIITVLALVYTSLLDERYKASVSFDILRAGENTTADYQYDDYYALSAAELFGQTITSWFLTPSFIVKIYETAELPPNIRTLESFTRRFKTRQYSPQNIVVTFTDPNAVNAEKIANAVIAVVEEETNNLYTTQSTDAITEASFQVHGNEPVIIAYKIQVWLIALSGFVSGFILSVILTYIMRYFKNE